jgi:hypothetical protein
MVQKMTLDPNTKPLDLNTRHGREELTLRNKTPNGGWAKSIKNTSGKF